MVDLVGPADAGASPTLTTTTDVSAPVAGDSWFEDCTSGVSGTGTPVNSKWLNRLMQQMRAAIRFSGVPESNSYDNMLSWAMQSGFANWVGSFGGSANALTGSAPNAPSQVEGGTPVCGVVGAPTNTGPTTFNWAGLGAAQVLRNSGAPCTGGEIQNGAFLVLRWDGGSWRICSPSVSVGLDVQEFDSSGTWSPVSAAPPEARVIVELWGAGAGGAGDQGGPGGAYVKWETYLGFLPSSVPILVGSGGPGDGPSATGSAWVYSAGGDTVFESSGSAILAPGGLSGASSMTNYEIASVSPLFPAGAGGQGGYAGYNPNAIFGGGGGAGRAAGGVGSGSGAAGAAGTSVFGGAGGGYRANGSAPGGGGGGSLDGTVTAGAGANGRAVITTIWG